jgi:hypothetical protein
LRCSARTFKAALSTHYTALLLYLVSSVAGALTLTHTHTRRRTAPMRKVALKMRSVHICSTFPKVIHDHVSEKSLSLSLLVECKRDNARELLSYAASWRISIYNTAKPALSFQNLCEMTCYSGQLVGKSTFTQEVCIFVELI